MLLNHSYLSLKLYCFMRIPDYLSVTVSFFSIYSASRETNRKDKQIGKEGKALSKGNPQRVAFPVRTLV